jgi:hypothetical protein
MMQQIEARKRRRHRRPAISGQKTSGNDAGRAIICPNSTHQV